MKAEEIVVNLIASHKDGRLVGRTRLQKLAYLLHRCGADFDLPFVYHHYGPYSFDLADGLTDARAEGRIEIEEQIGRHGIRYAIFKSKGDAGPQQRLGELSAKKARSLIRKMENVLDDIVLELAATIVFLRDEGGYGEQAVKETEARKPLKATPERIREACDLLRALDLEAKTASAG